jgi:hypothetical protein
MAAVIIAFLGLACIALGAFMTMKAQKRGETGKAWAWYIVAFAGALAPITIVVLAAVGGVLLIIGALYLLAGILSGATGSSSVGGSYGRRFGSWWGNQKVEYDSMGNLTWVGEGRVINDSRGNPLWVGDQKVEQDSMGNPTWVGTDRVIGGSDDKPKWIGEGKVEP